MPWVRPLDGGPLEWRDSALLARPVRASSEEELDAQIPGRKRARADAGDATAFDRETVRLMREQLVEGGASREWAQRTAETAARRNSGDAVPYHRTNTPAPRGHGG